MKKKNKIATLTSILSVALIAGTLIVPVYADHSSSKEEIEVYICEYCYGLTTTDINEMIEHEKICPENLTNNKQDTEEPTKPEETEKPVEPVTPVEPEEPTEPEETEKPVEPVTPEIPTEPETPVKPEAPAEVITITKEHNSTAKEGIMLTITLPSDTSNTDNDTEITTPSIDIEKLEAEVIEAERIASEAKAEADRLTTIAIEKRAELEALRQ